MREAVHRESEGLVDYCDTCKLDTNHGGYDFCPTETKGKLSAALLQINDVKVCLQDLRDLLAEQPKSCSRPFILGAIRRLMEYQEKYAEKPKCEVCGGINSNLCSACMGGEMPLSIEKRKEQP